MLSLLLTIATYIYFDRRAFKYSNLSKLSRSGENKVEWGQLKTGNDEIGMNYVGTTENKMSSSMPAFAIKKSLNIRERNHNHPSGTKRPSDADVKNAKIITKMNPNAKFNIYTNSNSPHPYTKDYKGIYPRYPGAEFGF